MLSPLHVKIALHYHVSPEQWPDLRIGTHREYADDLVNAGLLERLDCFSEPFYRPTGALAVWIKAICAMPFPVQKWVIPPFHPATDADLGEGGEGA